MHMISIPKYPFCCSFVSQYTSDFYNLFIKLWAKEENTRINTKIKFLVDLYTTFPAQLEIYVLNKMDVEDFNIHNESTLTWFG